MTPEEGLYERRSAGGRGLHRSRVDSAALHNPWRELGDEPTPGNALPPHRFVIAGGDVADKCGLGNTLRPGDQSPGYERKRSPPEGGSGHVRAGGRGVVQQCSSRIYSAAGKGTPRRTHVPLLTPRASARPARAAPGTIQVFPRGDSEMNRHLGMSARRSNLRATWKRRRLKAALPAVSLTPGRNTTPQRLSTTCHTRPQVHPQAQPASAGFHPT